MNKEDFIRDTAQKLFINGNLNAVKDAKFLAKELYPVDKEGLHEAICKILLFADFKKFQSSVVSMEEQYEELYKVLTKDVSEQDIQRFSHCRI